MPGIARILSIDGGGMRGLVPALILRYLERKTGKNTRDLFHMVAGASTGAIVGMPFALPVAAKEHTVSAREVVSSYPASGPEIFGRSMLVSSIDAIPFLHEALFQTKYSPHRLEVVMRSIFKDYWLSDAEMDMLIAAYNFIGEYRPEFFMSWRAQGEQLPDGSAAADYDYRMRDIIRAATAVPGLFPPARIVNASGTEALFADGLPSFNPADNAYAFALERYPRADCYLIVSLGTGRIVEHVSFDEMNRMGRIRLSLSDHLTNMLMDGAAYLTDQRLRLILGDTYFRFQFLLPPDGPVSRAGDDASAKNMAALKKEAARLLRDNRERLCDLGEWLAMPKTPREDLIA